MTTPFLIAHLVRGQPAFDIAEKQECSLCQGASCDECDEGYWWIIPTSGHRAYPYQSLPLVELDHRDTGWTTDHWMEWATENFLTPNWPDHYAINNRALRSAPTSSLVDRLGLNLRKPSAPIRRRV